MDKTRYDKGLKRLQMMRGNSGIGSALEQIPPDLNAYIREFAFGDVHPRAGLSPREEL